MFKDFISNATILIASFTIMGQIFKNRPLLYSSSPVTKLLWGLSYGALGNVLMLFSLQINPTTIADFRHLAIVIPAAFGGFFPALISSILIALGRIILFGINDTALFAAAGALLTGLLCGWFSKLNYHPTFKAFCMNLIGLLIISIVFAVYIRDPYTLTHVLVIHYIISLIGGFFAYHLSVFIANTNESERQLKYSLIKLKESEMKLQEANELLNRLSYMDGLTGVGNRRFFDDTIEKEWLEKSPITLLMFDIDYFKKYNDTYGHLAGDRCLQMIAKSIKDLLIENQNYTFCRYGGEEFAIILPSTKMKAGIQIAKLIQQTIQSLEIPHNSSEISNLVTLSIGIATMAPSTLYSPKELIHHADTALYKSKTLGRNTISIFSLEK